MIIGLILHIVLTVMALCYLSRQLRAHSLAILAMAKAMVLLAEKSKHAEMPSKDLWT